MFDASAIDRDISSVSLNRHLYTEQLTKSILLQNELFSYENLYFIDNKLSAKVNTLPNTPLTIGYSFLVSTFILMTYCMV